ncbi:MAG: hypothetical protein RLZZ127_390 [Planctomycetota bacterium]|jgi:hypothetical protein
MRRTASALLLALAAALPGVDTPLVIPSSGNLVAVVEPGSGAVGLYSQEPSGSTRKGGALVVSEIEFAEKLIVAERDGALYPLLRVGTTNNLPTAESLLPQLQKSLESALAKRPKDPAKPVAVRIRDMENAWWGQPHAYDGKIVGALADRYLLLGIPSKRALALYDIGNEDLRLVVVRGLGPELYVPAAYGASRPSPQEVIDAGLRGLRQRLTDPKVLKEAEDRAREQLDALALGPGVGDPSQPAAALPPIDLWIGTSPALRNAFLVVDASGPRAMLFQYDGQSLALRGVRNLALDLAANQIAGEAIKSRPGENQLLDQLLADQTRMVLAQRHRLVDLSGESDREKQRESLRGQLAALVASRSSGGGGGRTLDAAINGTIATLIFPQQRRLISLDLAGGNQVDLGSVRDYTVDLGVATLTRLINERTQGAQAYELAAKGGGEGVRRNLELALSLDPFLHERAAKDGAFRNIRSQAWWQPLIDEAAAKAAALDAAFKDRAKAK